MQPSLLQQHANYRTNCTTILLKPINTQIINRNSYRIKATIIQNNNANDLNSINGIIFGNSTFNAVNSSNINNSHEYQRQHTTMPSIIALNTNRSRNQNNTNDDTQTSEPTLSKNQQQQEPLADASIETMLANSNSSNGSSSSASMAATATTTLFAAAAAAGACTFQTVDGHGCMSNNSPNNTSTNSNTALENYRLQLYNYALNIERLRCPQYSAATAMAVAATYASNNTNNSNCSVGSVSSYPSVGSYMPGTGRHFALSMSSLVFPQRLFQPDEPKPQHSYIGLIAMAILSSTETKLVLSDIYQYILDNYPYFRARGPGWRNSIRHNLSLNDCFIKSGRSANGKGHYWAIHPANMDDFRKGDFRRRKAQRKVRKHMGLSVDDAGTDSPSPPLPLSITPPPTPTSLSFALAAVHHPHHNQQLAAAHHHLTTFGYLQQPTVSPFHQQHQQQNYLGQPYGSSAAIGVTAPHYATQAEQNQSHPSNANNNNNLQQPQQYHHHPLVPHQLAIINETTTTRTRTASVIANLYSQTRKRQFDVASLLAPDVKLVDIIDDNAMTTTIEDDEAGCDDTGGGGITTTQHTVITKVSVQHQHHHQHHKQQLAYQLEQKQHLAELVEDQEDIDVCVSDEGEEHDQGQYHKSTYDETDDNNSLLSISRSRRSSLDAGNSSRRQSPHSSDTTTTTTTVERLNIQQRLTPLQQDDVSDEGAKATAIELSNINMNPHIFGRYYGSYMAAARRMHAASAALESSPLSQQHQYQEQQQSLPP